MANSFIQRALKMYFLIWLVREPFDHNLYIFLSSLNLNKLWFCMEKNGPAKYLTLWIVFTFSN